MGSACSGGGNDATAVSSSSRGSSAINGNKNPQKGSSISSGSGVGKNPLLASSLLPGFAVSSVPEDELDHPELICFDRRVEDALSDISHSEVNSESDASDSPYRHPMTSFGKRFEGSSITNEGDSNGTHTTKNSAGGLSNSGHTTPTSLEKQQQQNPSHSGSSLPTFANRLGPNGTARQVGTLVERDRTVDVPDIDAELFIYDDVAVPKSNDNWVHKQLVASRRAFLSSSGAGRLVSTAGRSGLTREGSAGPASASNNFQFGDFHVNIMVDELDRAVSMPFDEANDDDGLGMDAPGDDFGFPPGEGQNRTSPTGIQHDDNSNSNNNNTHLLSAGGNHHHTNLLDGRSKTPTRARTPNDGSRMNDTNPVSHHGGSASINGGNGLEENRKSNGSNSFVDSGGSDGLGGGGDSSEGGGSMMSSFGANSSSDIPEGAVMLRSGTTCRSITITNRNAQIRLMQQMAKIARRKSYNHINNFKVRTLIGHSCRVKCIAIAPGEKEFVSCSNEDAVVTLYSLVDGKEIANFPGHRDTVISATFSPDGKFLATTSRDHTMVLWDVVTAKQILTFDHAKVVICCVFSRDSRYVATGCQDKVCRLWETRRGKETVIFSEHDGIIISMAYSPSNHFIASASADRTIRVWSTNTGKAEHVLRGHTGIVLSCSFTNDSMRVISNDEKVLKVWSATTGDCLKTILVEDVARGAPIPLGMRKLTWTLSTVAPGLFSRFIIAACNNRFVYVLDVITGEELTSYFCKAPVYCLNTGHQNTVGFGDSFGNVYIATID